MWNQGTESRSVNVEEPPRSFRVLMSRSRKRFCDAPFCYWYHADRNRKIESAYSPGCLPISNKQLPLSELNWRLGRASGKYTFQGPSSLSPNIKWSTKGWDKGNSQVSYAQSYFMFSGGLQKKHLSMVHMWRE